VEEFVISFPFTIIGIRFCPSIVAMVENLLEFIDAILTGVSGQSHFLQFGKALVTRGFELRDK